MKTIIGILVLGGLIWGCSKGKEDSKKSPSPIKASNAEGIYIIEEQTDEDTLKGSLKARASNNINSVIVSIAYSSPAVRGRIVWGGLVPYDRVWVTGAHMATSIEFERAITYGEKEIPAGKYGLFTIPGTEIWTVIINKNWNQHLTDEYDEKDDLVRSQVKPQIMETNQERLMYEVDQTGEGKFSIIFSWEKIRIEIPFELD